MIVFPDFIWYSSFSFGTQSIVLSAIIFAPLFNYTVFEIFLCEKKQVRHFTLIDDELSKQNLKDRKDVMKDT